MTAFNVVRFRVKPGREEEFLEAHRRSRADFPGFKRFVMIKSGERTYCIIGEWDSFQSLGAARPKMIALLDTFRDTLEELGGGLGVTDPVSGEVVLVMKPRGVAIARIVGGQRIERSWSQPSQFGPKRLNGKFLETVIRRRLRLRRGGMVLSAGAHADLDSSADGQRALSDRIQGRARVVAPLQTRHRATHAVLLRGR